MKITHTLRLAGLTVSCFKPVPSALAIAIGVTLGTLSAPTMATDANPFAVELASADVQAPQLLSRAVGGPDSDGDGIRNQDDLDDDNDGILDTLEGGVDNDGNGVPDASSVDTDSDGTPDVLDLDSDNDGILDNLEARLDRNAVKALDQNPNGAIDIGINVGNNGLADVIETSADSGQPLFALPDTDQDGTPDFRDLDSDNDGIYDLVEAGGVDNDTDGRLDGFFDQDGKGVDDTVQSSALPIFDTDGDGQLDFRDLDSDADTISDQIESGGNRSNPTDTDGDGAPDYRETDSDGDGVRDGQESGGSTGPVLGDLPQGSGDGRPDRDADGIANQDDLDDDNDTILDSEEGIIDANGDGVADANSRDSDGDGTPDGNDLDSDNDGILDILEARFSDERVAGLDPVGIGAVDIRIAVGSNGVPDIIETSADSGAISERLFDTDGDGTPDFMDVDSDNDGISDLMEAGGTDTNGDGRIDGFIDQDTKGVDDRVQASALPRFDTDGDGIPDYRDLDSDGDTVPDSVEGGGNYAMPTDTDGDGAPDYRETDSDGDGIPDGQENGGNTAGPILGDLPQRNDDGRPDRDADGIANQDDLDDDNDTILDSEEGIIDANGDGVADANSRDSDGDGTPDGNDLDSDNDGILDILEARLSDERVAALDPVGIGAVDIRIAVGANGIPDVIETSPDSGVISEALFDTDGDGTLDYIDVDSDNDGISDLVEAGGIDANGDGRIDGFVDGDSKGVDDRIQASALPRFDTDGDGIRDYRDLDSDADNIPDSVERGSNGARPADTDGDGAADYREQDSDNDGVSDTVEAGSDTANPADSNGDGTPDFQDGSVQTSDGSTPVAPVDNQTGDHDGDGQIDAMDTDDDNDGIADFVEGSGDADQDGVPNRLDRDSDNDGVLDSLETAVDTDGDGIADYLDLDSDNDGVFDSLEAGHVNAADSGRLASAATVDAFGLAAGASGQRVDTDGDGVADMIDLDSDNDGLPDLWENGLVDADLNAVIDNFIDANSDGASDSLAGGVASTLIDTDHDRIANIRDLDSDQDGLSDRLENYGPDSDQDNDGRVDNFVDTNKDGLDDNVAAQLAPLKDTDNDGVPNYADLDSDGDGISDLQEAGGADADRDSQNDLLADSDGDGIPDLNDADITGGNDADGDSIDDAVDTDFVAGADTDKDGVVDSADPDVDGNGFAGPFDDASGNLTQGTPVALPDADGDGVADLNQGQALSDFIETGVGGSGFGCSIGPIGSTSKSDPMLGFLLAGSVMFLAARLRRRRLGAVAVIASTAALSGCGVLDTGNNDRDFENRVYAGLGLLGSQLEPDTSGVLGTSVDDSQSAGASAMVGYDISNRFSVEGHLASLGKATLAPAGSVDYTVGGVSGVIYGLNDDQERSRRQGFAAFGRLGVGTMANDAEVVDYRRVNDLHLLIGVGMEYGLQNGLGLRAELMAHETDAKYAQLGVVYRFGEPTRSRSSGPAVAVRAPAVEQPEAVELTQPAPDSLPITAPVPSVQPDSDGDGVLGAADLCPETAPGLPVKEDGCAVFDGAIEGIAFEPASDTLTSEALTVLTGVARTLRDYPEIRVTVEAHTDNLGEAAANLQLSKRRAIAVASFLVDQGISGSRLKPQAFGEAKPRASNLDAAGRAANRRVEFTVLP